MPADSVLRRALLDVWRAVLLIYAIARFAGPVRLRLAMESLGVTYLKLGQFLAMRFDILPAAYCQELGTLFDSVPPAPFDTARQVVEAELGKPVDTLYASFERESL